MVNDLKTEILFFLNRVGLSFVCVFFFSVLLYGQTENPDSLYQKGTEYHAQDAYDHSLKFYLKAANIYDSTGNTFGLNRTYNSIGLIYFDIKNYQKSQYYYKKSLKGLNAHPDERLLSYVLNNLGMVMESKGYLDTAIFYYGKSLEIKKKLKDSISISRTHNNIGGVLLLQGKYDASLNSYHRSLRLKSILKDSFGLATVHTNIANIHGWKNNLDSVEYYLKKGIKYIQGKDRPAAFLQFYTNYGALYYELKDFEKAYLYADSAMKFLNKSFNEKLTVQIAKHQTIYDLQEKEQALRYEQAENALLKEKRSRERIEKYVLIAIISSLVVVLILLYIILKNRAGQVKQNLKLLNQEKELNAVIREKNKQKEIILKNEIELKSKELVSNSALVLQKQEIISELKYQLDQMRQTNKGLPDHLIKELESTVKLDVNLDQEWKRFKVHFEKVHSSFFRSLKDQFPNLTETDLRHCAYIKIGLTTKEIATLLNITPASVQKSRVRLKKKLVLSKSDDLYHFINSYLS